jgi:hypothetical protein
MLEAIAIITATSTGGAENLSGNADALGSTIVRHLRELDLTAGLPLYGIGIWTVLIIARRGPLSGPHSSHRICLPKQCGGMSKGESGALPRQLVGKAASHSSKLAHSSATDAACYLAVRQKEWS